MFGLIRKNEIISILAKELAEYQKDADYWYYVRNDQDMSSFMLDKASVIKEIATKFNVCDKVYEQAYKIYDFRNSGKDEFKPDYNLLKKIHS